MSRYIEVNDAYEVLTDYYHQRTEMQHLALKEALGRVPTVDVVEVKHGKWIWVDGVRCSNCNHKLQTTGLPSYCPNCGAKMKGEHE